jgi:magnesium-transporting ATPase (P-type)
MTPDLSWHACEVPEVLTHLDTTDSGLDATTAESRRAQFGPNQLADQPPPHPLMVLLRQFTSPLIFILLGATALTLALAEYLDAAVIAVVLGLNATIGFIQERKAEGAVRALMNLVVPRARVMREGHEWEIDSRDLVPGDIVLLEPGARVPADMRLVWVNGLTIDESLLTGESMPVDKSVTVVAESAVLADRTCMAFTGAVVTSGRGRGVVVATGNHTALGGIANLVRAEAIERTPLQQRMDHLSKVVGVVVGIASVVAFVSGVALGGSVHDMFLTAVALAVAAIPEGLPVAFTITLALGVHRMARREAIVRRLPAVETLGSTTMVGSDKTGTLTENRMTVTRLWTFGDQYSLVGAEPTSGFAGDTTMWRSLTDDEALRDALIGAVLSNEAEAMRSGEGWHTTGDPTEVAMLIAAIGAGLEPEALREQHQVIAEIPFESERRYSATVCHDRERPEPAQTIWVKGAPEQVLAMCTSIATPDGVADLDAAAVVEAAQAMASNGLRVLATARGHLDLPVSPGGRLSDPTGLVFTGLHGMMDPPRVGVREAIATCRRAGVDVAMITGDHRVTAAAIATDLGIGTPDVPVLTGAELADLSETELRDRVVDTRVFARVSPEDKLRIVRSFKDSGHVVAVTGDGVNDAPALRAADIGVAMGKGGTDVAREAADMVLTDDNFVSIAAAVEEGRVTFDNVRKVTFFLLSTGAATILAILVGVWLQWPLIMLPAQLLWLNLVTNGLQDVALAFEPAEPGVLDRRPRRRREGVLSAVLWQRTVLVGVVMAAGTLSLFRWELNRSGSESTAQSVALTTMVVFMALHVGNSRAESTSVFRLSPWSNRFLFVAAIVAMTVHIAALYLPPTQFVLRVEPIDLAAWVRIVPVAASIVVVVEIDKALRRRLARRR